MPTYDFMQVDAFTTYPLGGNPCAIVFHADDLTDEQMQAITVENNLSETSFVMASEKADFRVRYFTPAAEIPFAGHPTIATTHALIERGEINLQDGYKAITLEMQAGIIDVEARQENEIVTITLTSKAPHFGRTYDASEVMPIFGLSADDARDDVPIQTVSTGTPHLMIPLKTLEALKRATMNHKLYRDFRENGDFYGGPHLFCLNGVTESGDTFARHPGLPPSTYEDPFTGSSTASMASYLWHYRLLDKPTFTAEQGHWMNRPGQAHVEVLGEREKIQGVRVSGTAVTVITGQIKI